MATSTTAMTTISITVTVYNGQWLKMSGIWYVFFFFLIFLFFLLNQDLQSEPPHVVITHTCTRINRTRDAMLLDPKGMFFFFALFFLIQLTLLTDHFDHLNNHHLDHHPNYYLCHLNASNDHKTDDLASSASGASSFNLNTWCSAFKTINQFLGNRMSFFITFISLLMIIYK